MKKTLLSIASATALLGALAAPAFASPTFHLVVPLGARTQAQEPVEAITVSLSGAALPRATLNKAYSHSLQDYLAVTGDKALDKSAARWSLAAGTLPAGLSLDETTGSVDGTPTAKTTSPASFTVLSTYKGADGQASYTLVVGGAYLKARQISAGEAYSCAVTDTGGVKCWGANTNGQLGDGSTAPSSVPVPVIGLTSGVKAVEAGGQHTCAIMEADGSVKCWGSNFAGQLGNNSKLSSTTPVTVQGLSGVTKLSAGSNYVCALASGAVKCWGLNQQGQLGIGASTSSSLVPVQSVGLGPNTVIDIAANRYHACAVTTTGSAKCWGWNNNGQIGLGGLTPSSVLAPIDVPGLSKGVTAVGVGHGHSCAVVNGGVKCWGHGELGQLGITPAVDSYSPVVVPGLESGVTGVSSGFYHNCASTASGVKCWGYNNTGPLGNGISSEITPLVATQGLSGRVSSLDMGMYHSCAIDDDVAKCWGSGASGAIGNNSTTNALMPTEVQPGL